MKGILPWEIARGVGGLSGEGGAQVMLGNTYHLLLRPGPALVKELGGLHAFSGWGGAMLTDSGGYQAYSMADINRFGERGVSFKSIVDGSEIELTPELAVEVQNDLGADIIMPLDDCPPSVDPKTLNQARLRILAQQRRRGGAGTAYDHAARLDEANERTVRWLERSKAAHARADEQALFGIVQGGTDLDRRSASAAMVTAIELPGYAIGGVAVGEGFGDIKRVVEHTAGLLPWEKPRYLMGVGYERDIVAAVRAGVDMFDCVLPARNGRNANAFTPRGQIRLKNARFAADPRPLDESYALALGMEGPGERTAAEVRAELGRAVGGDPVGEGHPLALGVFSRAYLRHLFLSKEMLGPVVVSLHNVRHFLRLALDIRRAIADDAWPWLASRWPVAFATDEGVVRA
jgi:queuine tRNA-ribosyltransferase